MKRIISAEHGDDLAELAANFIKTSTVHENGDVKIYRPTVVIEIFDQNGQSVI